MNNNFLKVMIMDDEANVRSLLKKCIPWNEIGFDIVAEASSAREALDTIGDIMPDIIFADICMPFMDGIEFSKIVTERYPRIKIVVLTAHDEFEYAKEGIKIGISEYILKPIDRVEIRRIAEKLKSKIEEEQKFISEYNVLKKQLEENLPILKERFLNELLQNNLSKEGICEKMAYFGISKISEDIQIAVIEYAESNVIDSEGEEERLLLGFKCIETVKQYFKNDMGLEIFFDITQKIVIFNSNPTVDMVEGSEQIKAMMINFLKCYVNIGIGNKYKGIENARQSYREACEALGYKVIAGWNNVVNYNEMTFEKQDHIWDYELATSIRFYIKVGVENKATEAVERIFTEIEEGKVNSIEYLRIISINIISEVYTVIHEIGLRVEDVFEVGVVPYNRILNIDNLPDMKNYTNQTIIEIINRIKVLKKKKDNSVINSIQEYILTNLSDSELSLSSVAKGFFLNSSYLSRLFKQETGLSFIEFLTQKRIEKAVELFNNTDLKAYEIAVKVGIPEPKYFCMCFKKITGVSVNDFKKHT